jgi:hypothetical protein
VCVTERVGAGARTDTEESVPNFVPSVPRICALIGDHSVPLHATSWQSGDAEKALAPEGFRYRRVVGNIIGRYRGRVGSHK